MSKLRREKKNARAQPRLPFTTSRALRRSEHTVLVCVRVRVRVYLEPLSHTALVLNVVFLEFYPAAIKQFNVAPKVDRA
jgi:hypothetical protein